jgi:hypothetical protein
LEDLADHIIERIFVMARERGNDVDIISKLQKGESAVEGVLLEHRALAMDTRPSSLEHTTA